MIYKFVAIFFFVFLSFSFGNNNTDSTIIVEKTILIDSSRIEVLSISDQKIRNYKSDPEFDYYSFKEPEGLLDRIKRWLWMRLVDLMDFMYADGKGEILFYIVVFFVVLAIIYNIAKKKGINLFYKVNRNKNIGIVLADDEDLNIIQYENEIDLAIVNRNFRLAVRYIYLKVLNQMNQTGIIKWSEYKTNRDYFYEIKLDILKKDFALLTKGFEYSWYGEFSIDNIKLDKLREIEKRLLNNSSKYIEK